MSFPSIKTLSSVFGPEKGRALRELYEELNKHWGGWTWRRQSQLLEAANEILGGHGVEGIERGLNRQSPPIEYVNIGDTYDCTLLLIDGQTWAVGSWGDRVEKGRYR